MQRSVIWRSFVAKCISLRNPWVWMPVWNLATLLPLYNLHKQSSSERGYNHSEHGVGMKAKERTITPLPHPLLNKLRDVWSSRSPLLLFAIKSALAAGFSWAIVSSLLGEEAAALAVVSAVIVVQVTSWQTARKSIERVLGVIIGVILAVPIAHLFGLKFWTITLMIFSSHIIVI